eukprot:scaffold8559_cov248-Pinguiococcus_pyrenoidosus.AAC.3
MDELVEQLEEVSTLLGGPVTEEATNDNTMCMVHEISPLSAAAQRFLRQNRKSEQPGADCEDDGAKCGRKKEAPEKVRVLEADPYGLRMMANSFEFEGKPEKLGWMQRIIYPDPFKVLGGLAEIDAIDFRYVENTATGESWLEVHKKKAPRPIVDYMGRVLDRLIPAEYEPDLPPEQAPLQRMIPTREAEKRYSEWIQKPARLEERGFEGSKAKIKPQPKAKDIIGAAETEDDEHRRDLLLRLASGKPLD